MTDVYHHAKVHEIPSLRAHAVGVRRRVREATKGLARLFDPGDAPVTSEGYKHSEPWQPPDRINAKVELDSEPPPEATPENQAL